MAREGRSDNGKAVSGSGTGIFILGILGMTDKEINDLKTKER